MSVFRKFLIKLVGKKIINAVGGEEKWATSRTKLTAIVAVIITGIDTIPAAFGHPVVIPPEVYNFLAAIGLWSLRDGMQAKENPKDTAIEKPQ